ncbi:MAG: GumC family protein [Alphaproteobacteria bacterium]|nr:GumC family protein [Alphaproteobacteria bacterium]
MPPEEQPLLPLGLIIAALWERKFLIAACVAAALILTLLYLLMEEKTYKATAVLLVEPRTPNVTEATEVLPGYGADSAAIASQVEVLGSSTLLDRVIEAEEVAQDPEFTRTGMMGRLSGSAPSKNEIFETFRDKLDVVRQGSTYVINVSFSSTDPDKAARIANAVVDAYLRGERTQSSALNNQVNEQLGGRIEVLRQSVAKAEAAVADYRASKAIVETGAGGTLLQARIEQVNTQLVAALGFSGAVQNALKLAEENAALRLDLAVGSVDTEAAARLRADLDQLEAQRSRLSTSLGAMHPQMRAIETELARVQTSLRAEVQRDILQKRSEAQRAQQNADNLTQELSRLRSELDSANQQQVELNQLQRQAAAARGVLEQFERRAEEIDQLDGLQQPNARVITPASAPTGASWPKPKLLLPVMGAFGAFVGIALALLVSSGSLAFPSADRAARGGGRASRRPRTWPVWGAHAEAASAALDLGTLVLNDKSQPGARHLQFSRMLLRIVGALEPRPSPHILAVAAPEDDFLGLEVTEALAQELSAAGTQVLVIDVDDEASRQDYRILGLDVWPSQDLSRNRARFAQMIERREPVWISLAPAGGDAVREEIAQLQAAIGSEPDFVIIRSLGPQLAEALGELLSFELTVLDKESQAAAGIPHPQGHNPYGIVRVERAPESRFETPYHGEVTQLGRRQAPHRYAN